MLRPTLLTVALFTTAFACGGSNTPDPGSNGGSSGSGSGGSGSGSGGSGGSGSGGSGGSGSSSGPLGSSGSSSGTTGDGCSDAARLVYVLSAENDLYSFDPPNKAFKKIGPLGCKTSMTPNSMAVSRDAVAWVNYTKGDDSDGAIFKVSTADASCATTNVQLSSGWFRLGMGFSTDAASSTTESLFVAATGGLPVTIPGLPPSPGLGKLDLTTQTLTPVGSFTGALAGQDAELTGTGDARLFGFFTTTPVQVAEIDKATGATSNVTPLPAVEVPSDWAFSFWGGDFYLYTSPGSKSRTSNVTHYSPGTGAVDTAYMTNVGFNIVGAGVSTCAPTAPPK